MPMKQPLTTCGSCTVSNQMHLYCVKSTAEYGIHHQVLQGCSRSEAGCTIPQLDHTRRAWLSAQGVRGVAVVTAGVGLGWKRLNRVRIGVVSYRMGCNSSPIHSCGGHWPIAGTTGIDSFRTFKFCTEQAAFNFLVVRVVPCSCTSKCRDLLAFMVAKVPHCGEGELLGSSLGEVGGTTAPHLVPHRYHGR
jgi:hypothetical protein